MKKQTRETRYSKYRNRLHARLRERLLSLLSASEHFRSVTDLAALRSANETVGRRVMCSTSTRNELNECARIRSDASALFIRQLGMSISSQQATCLWWKLYDERFASHNRSRCLTESDHGRRTRMLLRNIALVGRPPSPTSRDSMAARQK